MEFKEGIQLIDTSKPDIPETLATLHNELHSLDPTYLIEAIAAPKNDPTRYSMIDYLEEYIKKHGYTRLYPALEWVLDKRINEKSTVVCHGDFHQGNILWYDDRVSAVLDWGTFRFDDPAYDVARTIVSNQAFLPFVRPELDCEVFLSRYYKKYREISDIDPSRVDFFRTVNCLYGFFSYENGVEPWGIPIVQNRIIEIFIRLTGIDVPFLSK